MNIKPLFLTATLALALSGIAQAQTGFTVSLTNPDQFVAPNASATFHGTLTNNTGFTLDLYGGSFSGIYGPGNTDLSLSDYSGSFFSPTPVLLNNGQSLGLDLFTATPGTNPGDVSGGTFYFSAQELDNNGDFANFISTDAPDPAFTVTANGAPVPEASPAASFGLLLALGTLGLAGLKLSARRRQN